VILDVILVNLRERGLSMKFLIFGEVQLEQAAAFYQKTESTSDQSRPPLVCGLHDAGMPATPSHTTFSFPDLPKNGVDVRSESASSVTSEIAPNTVVDKDQSIGVFTSTTPRI
jgi:hypothetical protein